MAKSNKQNRNRNDKRDKYRDKDVPETTNPKDDKQADKLKQSGMCDKGWEGKHNDWEWYVPNEQLLKDVASFPFGYATGAKYPWTSNLDNPAYNGLNNTSAPGIMSIYLTPTVGWAEDATAPINVVARKLYTYIRAANSGAKNYDAPDLMIYLVAMDSLFSYLAWMKRLYGVINVTTYDNRYLPYGITEACGGNYSDLRKNLADFRYYINTFAVRLSALVVPGNMSYFTRHEYIYSKVFSDTTKTKDQMYVYEPNGFFVFGLDQDGAGTCSLSTFEEFGMDGTYAKIVEYGEHLLNPVLLGEGDMDFNIISGDIMKAYGNLIRMATQISTDYVVIPENDTWALGQIQNATMYGPVSVAVKQDRLKGHLISTPQVLASTLLNSMDSIIIQQTGTQVGLTHLLAKWRELMNSFGQGAHVINSYDETPGPEHVIVYSRLTNGYRLDTEDNLELIDCGSEVATHFMIWSFNTVNNKYDLRYSSALRTVSSTCIAYPAADPNISVAPGPSIHNEITKLRDRMYSDYNVNAMISQFRYHPYTFKFMVSEVYALDGSSANDVYLVPQYLTGDTSNYTYISNTNLRNMANVALLKEFGIVG